jgi:hypothetical protein
MPVAHLIAMVTVAVGRLTVSNIRNCSHFVHGEEPSGPFLTSTRKHKSSVRWSPNGVMALSCSQAFTSGTSSRRKGRLSEPQGTALPASILLRISKLKIAVAYS